MRSAGKKSLIVGSIAGALAAGRAVVYCTPEHRIFLEPATDHTKVEFVPYEVSKKPEFMIEDDFWADEEAGVKFGGGDGLERTLA